MNLNTLRKRNEINIDFRVKLRAIEKTRRERTKTSQSPSLFNVQFLKSTKRPNLEIQQVLKTVMKVILLPLPFVLFPF